MPFSCASSSSSGDDLSEQSPRWRPGVSNHFKELYTHPVKELLAERDARQVLTECQNQPSSLPAVIVVPEEKPPLSNQVVKKKTMTRWPQMTSLMKDDFYARQILRMLQGCYEADCITTPNAKDGPDIKGNAWIKYHYLCFGGGEPERGLVKEFPVIDKPTVLKQKVIQIWKYCIANEAMVPKDLFDISQVQYGLYSNAVKAEKEAKLNEVVANNKLKDDMEGFEGDSGAIPPGAKGKDGAGCTQHSTNLMLGDPASYLYATTKTPKKKPPSSNTTSSVKASSANSNKEAERSMHGMDNMMSNVLNRMYPESASKKGNDDVSSLPVDAETRAAKRMKLLEKSKHQLMEEIKFQKDVGEDYSDKYKDYLSTCAMICAMVEDQEEDP
jgi:hypothetical protein